MPTILAVDDSPISRQIYDSVLKSQYQVVLAQSAEEAWDLISFRQFDLVITDVNLPGISGPDLLKKLRAQPQFSKIPVIIISGDADGIENAKNTGADLWLLKPVNPQSLTKAVETLLKN